MSMCSFLVSDDWNKVNGVLKKCDEATVDGEKYINVEQRPEINENHFWAVVTGHLGGDMHEVEDADGNMLPIMRERL